MQNYLTLTELSSKLGGRSRAPPFTSISPTVGYPQPIKLGGRLYWPEKDVETHLRALRDEGLSS